MTITQELVERVERAAGPDRELDCLIQVAVTPDAKCMTDPGHGTVGSTFGVMRDIDFDVWRQHRTGVLGPFYYGEPPAYTASIDAAMTLVPEGWWLYAVDASITGRFVVSLRGPLMAVEYEDTTARISDMMIPAMAAGIANSLATAVTAASLRARMQS